MTSNAKRSPVMKEPEEESKKEKETRKKEAKLNVTKDLQSRGVNLNARNSENINQVIRSEKNKDIPGAFKAVSFLKTFSAKKNNVFKTNNFAKTKLIKDSKIKIVRQDTTHQHLLTYTENTSRQTQQYTVSLLLYYLLHFIDMTQFPNFLKTTVSKVVAEWETVDKNMKVHYLNRDAIKNYLNNKTNATSTSFLKTIYEDVMSKLLFGEFHFGFNKGIMLNARNSENINQVIRSVVKNGIADADVLRKYCIPVLSLKMQSRRGFPLRQEQHPVMTNERNLHRFSVKFERNTNFLQKDDATKSGNSVFAVNRLRKVLKPKEEKNKRTSLQYTGNRPLDVLNNTNIFAPSRRRVETRPNPPMKMTNVVKTQPKTALQKALDKVFP